MTDDIETHRKQLLSQQTKLRTLLPSPKHFDKGIALLMSQHAALHSGKIAEPAGWSFEDAVLHDLSEQAIRCIRTSTPHSIAWMLWHTTRCEDIAMNLLVADSPQILNTHNWYARLGVAPRDTGSVMDTQEIARLSNAIDLDALRGYRLAVGMRTREIIQGLEPADLKKKVHEEQIDRIMVQGAVLEAARGLAGYWGRRTVVELLLMPATRHNLVHLNEALKIKQALQSTQGVTRLMHAA